MFFDKSVQLLYIYIIRWRKNNYTKEYKLNLQSPRLTLFSADIEAAGELLPAFNGDEQFLRWSGYPSGMSMSQVQADIQETIALPGGVTWGITDSQQQLIGVAETAWYPSPSTGWISLLLIRHAFQKYGYGREVATLLEEYCFSSPTVTEIGLAVLAQNKPAQAFWEKRGYRRIAQRADTHGNDCYEYRLLRAH